MASSKGKVKIYAYFHSTRTSWSFERLSKVMKKHSLSYIIEVPKCHSKIVGVFILSNRKFSPNQAQRIFDCGESTLTAVGLMKFKSYAELIRELVEFKPF